MNVGRCIVWGMLLLAVVRPVAEAQPVAEALRPRHITPEAQLAVNNGLAYLARVQSPDGSYQSLEDGATYPLSMTAMAGMAFLANGNTTSRGLYAENVRKAAGRPTATRHRPS